MSKKILTKSQRDKLLIAHKLKENLRFVDKIKAILLLDDGWSFAEIAEALFVNKRTVRNHKKISNEIDYLEDRLNYFVYKLYGLSPEVIRFIEKVANA